MSLQIVNTGILPNDGLGDPLRNAFTTINDNFTTLQTLLYVAPVFNNAIIQTLSVTALNIAGDMAIGNGTINSNSPSTGTFRVTGGVGITDNLFVGANVDIGGNLTVHGTTTSINAVNLEITDKNIILALGSPNANEANGGGLTIDCGSDPDATFTYTSADDKWNLNKPLTVSRVWGTATNVSTVLTRGSYLTGGETTFDGTTASTWSVNATDANTGSTVVARHTDGSFSAGVITASLSGTATNADNVVVSDDVQTNAAKPITWVDSNSGYNAVKVSSTALTINPNTGLLSAKSFAGSSNGTLTTGTGNVSLNGNVTVGTDKTFAQTGTGTFSTGTGAVSLNGNVTVGTDKTFAQTGTGTFSTGTGAVSLNGNTDVYGDFTIKVNKPFAQQGTGTFSTGTGNISLNGSIITNINQTGLTSSFSTGQGNISLNGPIVTNINQAGTTTFSTGTGNVSLNGHVTVNNKNFSQTNNTTFSTGSGAVSLNGNVTVATDKTVTLGADPTLDLHAATKRYVDNAVVGFDILTPVTVATISNIVSFTLPLTVDDVVLTNGNRVLVKNQTAQAENGVYVVSADTLVRASDANSWLLILNSYVWVESGTTQADTGWVSTIAGGGTLNTTPINYEQFSAAATLIAGDGMSKTGNTLNIGGTTDRITVYTNSIDLATTYVGQSSITTVGALTAGSLGVGFDPVANSSLANSTIVIGTTSTALGATSPSLGGLQGISFASGNYNFDHSAASGTFSTGTGAVTINGDITVASGKNLTMSGGATFSTGTGNVSLNGNIVSNITQINGGTFTTGTGAVALNGNVTVGTDKTFAQTGTGTFSTGTGNVSLNGNVTVASGKNFNQTGTGTLSTGTGAVSLNGNVSVGAGKTLTLDSNPTLDMHAATKIYTDTVAHNLQPKLSVIAATTSALPAFTYNNGVDGVGATITANGSGALVIDTVSITNGNRVLVKNETAGNAPYNGVYTQTTLGDGGTAFVLTRATDFDAWSDFIGGFVWVESGTTPGGHKEQSWAGMAQAGGTLGSTSINFTQIGATTTLAGLSGSSSISISGGVIALTTIGNPGTGTSLKTIDVDSQGRVTSWAAATIIGLTPETVGFSATAGTTPKTLKIENTLTLNGSDSTTHTFPSSNSILARTDASQTFTGAQIFGAGTEGSPILTTTGDTNTGIYFPAADTISIGTGGSERIRFDANGRIGIGVGGVVPVDTSFSFSRPTVGDGSTIYFSAINQSGLVTADATMIRMFGIRNISNVGASASTLERYVHFYAAQGTVTGALTNQYGCYVSGSMVGATNNYGYFGDIQYLNGTTRYNLYMGGNAPNYLAGSLGIGTTALTGYAMKITKTATTGTASTGIRIESLFQSNITTNANNYESYASTASGVFDVDVIRHFYATGTSTFANVVSGGKINRQVGFYAGSSLSSNALANYGFYGHMTAGANNWNIYMAGTASNYLAGRLGIGAEPAAGKVLAVGYDMTGHTTTSGISYTGVAKTDVTGLASGFNTNIGTQLGGTSLGTLNHYEATQGTFATTVNYQRGFAVDSTLTGATYNYGFYGNIAAGTNRYNLFMVGTAANHIAGSLGIGALPTVDTNLIVNKNLTGNTTAYGIYNSGAIQADVTGTATYFSSSASADTVTLTNLNHYTTNQGSITGTVTNQIGFKVDSTLIGGTNNYGFYGDIPAAANRWNIYVPGTANNAIAGSTRFGGLTAPTATVDIDGTLNVTGNTVLGTNGFQTCIIHGAVTLPNSPLPVSSGGTGASSSGGALTNLLPAGGVLGDVLKTSGANSYYWEAGGGGGGEAGTRIDTQRYETTIVGAPKTTPFNISPIVYVPGAGQVRVYINGVRQHPDVITESGVSEVTVSGSIPVGDQVLIEVDGYVLYQTTAAEITTTQIGAIPASDVQSVLSYLNVNKITTSEGVSKTRSTGAAVLPVGTTAERGGEIAGYFRFNTELNQFEGRTNTEWFAIGAGGATGSNGNAVFYENSQTVTDSYTITSGKNAMSAGPIVINNGVIVTVPDGSVWTVV